MTLSLSRSPSEKDEHAYYEWAKRYFGQTCDFCEGAVPEDDPIVHDVAGKPRKLFCSRYCHDHHPQTAPVAWRMR